MTSASPDGSTATLIAGWSSSTCWRASAGPVPVGISKYDADYLAGSRAKALADRLGTPVMLLHHTRKAAAEDFVDEVSGTQGLAGAVDTVVVLKRMRGKADGLLQVTGRDVDENEFALQFDAALGAWALSDKSAAEVRLGATRAQVLGWVRDHEGATPKQVSDGLGIDHELAKKTCRRMASDGDLDTDGTGHYWAPLTTGVPRVPRVPRPSQGPLFGGHPGDTVSPDPDNQGEP